MWTGSALRRSIGSFILGDKKSPRAATCGPGDANFENDSRELRKPIALERDQFGEGTFLQLARLPGVHPSFVNHLLQILANFLGDIQLLLIDELDPAGFAEWIDAQPDVGPKWRRRYVRVIRSLPTTPTNKILKRVLVHQKFRSDRTERDEIWVRGRGEDAFRPFTHEDEKKLRVEMG